MPRCKALGTSFRQHQWHVKVMLVESTTGSLPYNLDQSCTETQDPLSRKTERYSISQMEDKDNNVKVV